MFDKRMFKKSPEELQEYFKFKKAAMLSPRAKGKGHGSAARSTAKKNLKKIKKILDFSTEMCYTIATIKKGMR